MSADDNKTLYWLGRDRIAAMWSMRHSSANTRELLREVIAITKVERDKMQAQAEWDYEATWWADTSYPL